MSTRDELLVRLPVTIGRMILREYDKEEAEVAMFPERLDHRGAAASLRVALAYISGSLSAFYEEVTVGEDWLDSLRAFLGKPDA